MKKYAIGVHVSFFIATLCMVVMVGKSLRLSPHHYMSVSFNGEGTKSGDQEHVHLEEEAKEEQGVEVYTTGSSLPDCSHACGPCFPCKRVMVSFKCSIAESCPIVYRCTCKGKYYHVPSN
ncbi:hypothetical protein CFOL_v3_24886 [Cephalotus follicularis]|uniref:Epidermal patterning factor-like protein n=1 Tax=Cephalotus follicularis TaxID=3775 RepID=A0A1Q3CMV2_CEPFO|nr:hypothetical protein CFOL_v3_24886 [Cephalotus follicularis]